MAALRPQPANNPKPQVEQPCTVYPAPNGRVRVEFDEPQRAVTPGQSLVIYDGDVVVGGGIILGAVPDSST